MASMKITVFCDVPPRSCIETDEHFRVLTASITTITILMVEALSTSEMIVGFYKTAWCNIP
jgi:hypothetical protein